TPLQTMQKYKNAGNVHFNTGKYNEAIAQYNKAIDICPKENVDDLAILYQNRAAAYEKLKIYNFVKADCSKALELNPRYIKALLRRARILMQLGDLEAALKDITTICIYKNFSDEILLLKAKMILEKLVEQHVPECTTHQLRFYMPTTHVIEIYYIKAFCKDPILSRLKYPENIPEFLKKPLQALKNKKYHDIIPLCTEIIESSNFHTLSPSSKLEVLLLRVTFYSIWMNYNAAINDFEMILSSKDAHDDVRVNALIKRANLHQEIGLQHFAFNDLELAITINPSCCDIYYHRGQAYLAIQMLDKAKRDFEKAIECNPNFSAAHMQKWYTHYHFAVLNKDLNLAEMTVRDVEKAFDKYSNSSECVCCYVLYAQLMSNAEQYQKADTTPLQRAQKYKNEGNIYFKTERYNEAVTQYNKAIDICPKEYKDELAIFYQNRAAAYEQLKKYSSVKTDCTKALELNPKYIKALLRRARVLEQTGDLESALKDMSTALEQVDRNSSRENFFMLTTHAIEIYYIKAFLKDPVLSRLECPENIPEFFKKPLQALKNGEYHNIILLCTEIIESPEFDTLPSSKLEVLLLRATFYLFWRKYDDARDDFKIILSSKDAHDNVKVNALIKRANLHREIGLQHFTFNDLELAITINPSCCDIYYHRGQAYLAIQMLDKAKRDFEKAIECNPNFSAAHMQKWYTHYHFAVLNKDLNLAEMTVRDVEKAFDKYSNSPECICCYVLYAQIMSKAQQYQKADTYFIKAIKKNPDYAIIYLLLWNSNIDDIEKYLNKALKLETCSIGGKLRCIEILKTIEIQRGNMEEAIKLSEKALAFCRTFKEMLYIYSVHAIKMHLDRNNQFGHIIHFLLSYFRFDKQNAVEFDKHISVNSDEPPEVLSPTAESEVKKLYMESSFIHCENIFVRN
ncbi:Mitochondrial import receptor subunit TOM70, partial [Cyphomyrmex costatus]